MPRPKTDALVTLGRISRELVECRQTISLASADAQPVELLEVIERARRDAATMIGELSGELTPLRRHTPARFDIVVHAALAALNDGYTFVRIQQALRGLTQQAA